MQRVRQLASLRSPEFRMTQAVLTGRMVCLLSHQERTATRCNNASFCCAAMLHWACPTGLVAQMAVEQARHSTDMLNTAASFS
jgi:hypothetical protein